MKGFLLLEAAVGIMLVSIAGHVLFFWQMQMHARYQQMRHRVVCLVEAQNIIEQLKLGFVPEYAQDVRVEIVQRKDVGLPLTYVTVSVSSKKKTKFTTLHA